MAFPSNGLPNLRAGAIERNPGVASVDPRLTLAELWTEFLDASASIINGVTAGIYDYDWGRFRAWLEERGINPVLAAITKQVLVDYIAELNTRPKAKGRGTLSRHSVQHYVRPIRTFLRWCVGEGYYPADPFAGPRGIMPHLGPRILKTATADDLPILLAGTDDSRARNSLERATRIRDRLIVILATDTGLRTGEVCRLTIGDVHIDEGYVAIYDAKWDNQRIVPISPETRAAVRRYLRRGRVVFTRRDADAASPDEPLILGRLAEPLNENGLYQALCRAYARGGGKGRFGLHRLRHFFGTEVQRRGMLLGIAKELMGHDDIKTTNAYTHVTVEEAKQAHAKATPLHALSPARRRKLA